MNRKAKGLVGIILVGAFVVGAIGFGQLAKNNTDVKGVETCHRGGGHVAL